MDAVQIILEFESPDRLLIEQDIYSEERSCVDFNLLIPCPEELLSMISGSCESDMKKLMEKHNKKFDLEDPSFKENVRNFITKNKRDTIFLSDENRLTEETLESLYASIKAYQKYGYFNWYDFNCDKWGVSRNAFIYSENKKRTKDNGFYFACGWSIPTKWLLALSDKWRGVTFKVYCRMEYSKREGYVSVYHFENGDYKVLEDIKRKF